MTPEFNEWWDSDKLTWINPYGEDTPVYWAWEGYASRDAEIESLRQQLAAEIMRLEIALRIKTEEHKCCSEDLMKLRESEQSGWKEAAIAWEVCGSIHEAFAKKKDALYSTRHSDFERHAEDARRMLSTESKEKVE